MSYCTNCGTVIESGAKFCSGCGIRIVEKENNEEVESSLISEIIPEKINVKNNIENYFSIDKKLFFGNKIPIKPLVRILKMFEDDDSKKIVSQLNHLFFYSIEQETSIGGWDLGFSLATFSNKLYLMVSNGEPLRHFTTTGTVVKKKIYEIYDFEEKNLKTFLQIKDNKLIIKDLFGNTKSYTISGHTGNHTRFVEELIIFISALSNYDINSIGKSRFITQDEFLEYSKPNLGEKVSKGCWYLIILFIAFVVFVFIMSVLFPTKH